LSPLPGSDLLWRYGLFSHQFPGLLVLLSILITAERLIRETIRGRTNTIIQFSFVALCLILVMCFTTCSLLGFYIFFETRLAPIFVIIMGWGYQPERQAASLSLILYTMTASLPLLVVIIVCAFELGYSGTR
jgi:NADH:ubiquinone oxidoreductase subunit 4 (subunit M)